jgi:UDP-N-acetylmuramate dehydrogenase
LRTDDAAFSPAADVPLAPLTTLGLGGAARWFTTATTIDDIAAAHDWTACRGVEMFVLGGGSNLVVADGGIDGLVVRIVVRGIQFSPAGTDTLVRAGAGEAWDGVVAAAVTRRLAGLECLSGIPGSVGGTPVQNVGAYGQEVGDTIERVTVFDRAHRTTAHLSNAECRFAYRMSRFKRDDRDRFVVCAVDFRLREGGPTTTYPDVLNHLRRRGVTSPTVADVRAAVLEVRRGKGMVIDPADPDTRSVGSFFMNPVVTAAVRATLPEDAPGFTLADGNVKIPAAWLIERAGFSKGHAAGRVGLSTKHPLAIVNRGGATAREVVAFAATIKRQVVARFGIALRTEPVFAGFGANPDVQYLQES